MKPEVQYTVDKVFRLADRNKDGKITYDEFFLLFYMIPAEKIRQNFNF
jgi:Ca2+-binding EF-hand superfamily protein